MKLQLAAKAQGDIASILDWSHEQFGHAARLRYQRLIARGLRAIAVAAPPAASRIAGDAAPGVRLFHLRHVRDDPNGTVARPRHLLAYRIVGPDRLIVLRVLHDAMDVPTRLVDDRDASF